MTTAITVHSSSGLVGRCDARCHDAKAESCVCICGGRLHGVGASRALERNTRDLLGDDVADALEAFAARTNRDASTLRVAYPDVQTELAL